MQPAGGPLHRSTAVPPVQKVDGLHQILAASLLLRAERHHQMPLQGLAALQVLHQDAGLGQLAVGTENPIHQRQGRRQQHSGVVAGQIQAAAGGLAVEPRGEGAGAGVHGEGCGALSLLAQLLGSAHHIGGHGLAQLGPAGDRPAEAAAHAGLLFGGWGQIQGQAGMTTQFALQSQPHDPAFRP